MPRFFDDYSNTYLTHDSSAGRKQQRRGWKFRENFKLYYEKYLDEWRAGPYGLAAAQQAYIKTHGEDRVPPLPNGWISELDEATNIVFYEHVESGRRTWVRPGFRPPPMGGGPGGLGPGGGGGLGPHRGNSFGSGGGGRGVGPPHSYHNNRGIPPNFPPPMQQGVQQPSNLPPPPGAQQQQQAPFSRPPPGLPPPPPGVAVPPPNFAPPPPGINPPQQFQQPPPNVLPPGQQYPQPPPSGVPPPQFPPPSGSGPPPPSS